MAPPTLDLQTVELDKPDGDFALIHGMAGIGSFHLILTAADSYSNWWANVYFGTGDNVYRPARLQTFIFNREYLRVRRAVG